MRVILDTNIWSYIGEQQGRAALEALVRQNQLTILTPPATLLEVLLDENHARRDRTISAMTSPHWVRLRTEADTECAEFVAEAKRKRPKWVRQLPLPGKPAELRSFWTRQIWRAAAKDSDRLADYHRPRNAAVDKTVYDVMKSNSLGARTSKWRTQDLRTVTLVPGDGEEVNLPGWEDGAPVEPWRFNCRIAYWHALENVTVGRNGVGSSATYADWLLPYLWPEQVTRNATDFTRFWFQDADLANMPRNWIRTAIDVAQLLGKVTLSAPRDGQLVTYLLDGDLFITEDRRLVTAVDLVRQSSPFPMADVRHLEIANTGILAVDAIREAVR
jgi:hypothetical protein